MSSKPRSKGKGRPPSVLRTKSGHGLLFVPAPASPSTSTAATPSLRVPSKAIASTSSSSSSPVAIGVVRSSSTSDRLAEMLQSADRGHTRAASNSSASFSSSPGSGSGPAPEPHTKIKTTPPARALVPPGKKRSSPSAQSTMDSRSRSPSPSPSAITDGHGKYLSASSTHSATTYQTADDRPTGVDSDAEVELNDVDDHNTATSTAVSVTHAKPDLLDADKYIPPYEPRKRSHANHRDHFADHGNHREDDLEPQPKHEDSKYGVTLVASLGRARALPFASRRIELELAWDLAPPPSYWDYLPGSRLVPSWRLRPGGHYHPPGSIRGALERVPLLGRAAVWL